MAKPYQNGYAIMSYITYIMAYVLYLLGAIYFYFVKIREYTLRGIFLDPDSELKTGREADCLELSVTLAC